MKYEVLVDRAARKRLNKLERPVRDRIEAAMGKLVDEPEPPTSLALTNRPGRRVRVGDYRIIYEVDDEHHTVTVINVGHRRDIYRDR